MTSPIAQQAISYPTRIVPANQSASLPATRNIHFPEEFSLQQDIRSRADVRAGVSSSWEDVLDVSPTCPTGECDYPTIRTLGVCVRTADISQHISVKNIPPTLSQTWNVWNIHPDIKSGGWNATLPLPVACVTSPVAYNMMTVPMTDSLAFPDDRDLYLSTIYRTGLIYSDGPDQPYPVPGDWSETPNFRAIEIVFYQCVKELKVSASNGSSDTRELASWNKVLESGSTPIWNFKCYVDDPEGIFRADGCILFGPDNPNGTTKQTTAQDSLLESEEIFSASRNVMNEFSVGFFTTLLGTFAWNGNDSYMDGTPSVMRYMQSISFGQNRTHEDILRDVSKASDNLARAGTNL